MPCLNIAGLLKIENGKLYAKNDCCEWIEVGNLTAASEEIPDPFATSDPAATYYACGKAAAVMDIATIVGEAVWDCLALPPTQWVGHVKAAVPGYHLGAPQIAYAVFAAQAVSLVHGENQVFKAEMIQQMVCVIAPFFTADGEPMTQNTFNDIKGAIHGPWNAANKGTVGSLWVNFLDVLGKTDVSNAAVMGATDSSANCDCPGVELPADPTPEWTDLTWAHYQDFTEGMGVWYHDDPPQDQDERGVITNPQDGNGFAAVLAQFTITAGDETTIKRIEVRWSADVAFDYAGENKVRVASTDLLTLSVDADPSIGGIFRQLANVNYSNTNQVYLAFISQGYSPEGLRELGDGIRLLSIAVGGTGRDPFV